MKKAAAILLAVLLLAGCSGTPSEIEHGLRLRSRILSAGSCSFDTQITADYADSLHSFTLHCEADSGGNVRFCVTKPTSIAGIEGSIDADSGKLTFGDTVLCFPLLADEQLSPVSAPWVLMKTLRAGFITSAGKASDQILLSIDDSYADDALHLDILLDGSDSPVHAEIFYREHKILSLDVKNFLIE